MRPSTSATHAAHHGPPFQRLFLRPSRNPVHRLQLTAQVAAGGAAGAAARAGADLAWHASAGGFPWPTFAINLVGCAVMGILMAVLHARPGAPMWAGPVLGSGFLGGFTTFSAFASDIRSLLAAGDTAVALSYALASVACCVGAAAAASALTERTVPAPPPATATALETGGTQ